MDDNDKLLDSFLERWPLSKVKRMTIEEYHQVSNKDTFCYWVEHKMRPLGDIRGTNSYKFEIFERKDKNKLSNSLSHSNGKKYSWYKRAGETRKEAFNSARDKLIEVIKASLNKDFNKIDGIKLAPIYKWKVAFLYSDKSIIPISDKKAVRWLADLLGMENYENSRISNVHKYLMDYLSKDNFWEEYYTLWKLFRVGYKEDNKKLPESKNSLPKGTSLKNINDVVRKKTVENIVIELRHNKLQQALFDELNGEFPGQAIMEKNYVDIKVDHDNRVDLYEVKIGLSAFNCIRNALGQVLEYAYKADTKKKKKLIVVGNHEANDIERDYIKHLQDTIKDIEFEYMYYNQMN